MSTNKLVATMVARSQRKFKLPRPDAKGPCGNNLDIWPLDRDAMRGAERAVWRATQAVRNDAARPRPARQMFKLFPHGSLGRADAGGQCVGERRRGEIAPGVTAAAAAAAAALRTAAVLTMLRWRRL